MEIGVWRAMVFLVGVALDLILMFGVESILGHDSTLMTPISILSYGTVGGIVGYIYAEKGWRSGFWLVAFFLILLLGSALFVGSRPVWNWEKEMRSLLQDALIIIAACVGAAAGSLLKRRLVPKDRTFGN
jgi:hypothetical protein